MSARLKRPLMSDQSSSSMSSSSSSDEEVDSKDLKSIKDYLPNRKELASQLFKSVKTEKIRLMLPQVLKKLEFNELEELCANELTGMSKKRILCILSGQKMMESSDTDDTIDSGPSLEIISDTEWLSDDDIGIKKNSLNSKSNKKETDKKKKKSDDKSGTKNKTKIKSEKDGKTKVEKDGKSKVKVKQEKKKSDLKENEKEGESLLDLLELEMRARAIRALIRKEEDAKNPKKVKEPANKVIASTSSNNVRQDNLREQLEKIDILMKHGEDEDILVVMKPTPTIELISSDSENEDHSKRENKKLQNERLANNEKPADLANRKEVGKSLESSEPQPNKDNEVPSPKNKEVEEGEIMDNDEENQKVSNLNDINKKPEVQSENKDKVKKDKKRKSTEKSKKSKLSKKIKVNSDTEDKTNENNKENSEADKETSNENLEEQNSSIEVKVSPQRKVKKKRNKVFDDKLLDQEEIINLDDYSDDMEVFDSTDSSDSDKVTITIKNHSKISENSQASKSSETWAQRYFQQDDVQNVIKESKMQSEIRKRLRERQRQIKSDKSPQVADSLESTSIPDSEKPIGSVEEYLALKGIINSTNSNSDNSNMDSEVNASQITNENKNEESIIKNGETLKKDISSNVGKKIENDKKETINVKNDVSKQESATFESESEKIDTLMSTEPSKDGLVCTDDPTVPKIKCSLKINIKEDKIIKNAFKASPEVEDCTTVNSEVCQKSTIKENSNPENKKIDNYLKTNKVENNDKPAILAYDTLNQSLVKEKITSPRKQAVGDVNKKQENYDKSQLSENKMLNESIIVEENVNKKVASVITASNIKIDKDNSVLEKQTVSNNKDEFSKSSLLKANTNSCTSFEIKSNIINESKVDIKKNSCNKLEKDIVKSVNKDAKDNVEKVLSKSTLNINKNENVGNSVHDNKNAKTESDIIEKSTQLTEKNSDKVEKESISTIQEIDKNKSNTASDVSKDNKELDSSVPDTYLINVTKEANILKNEDSEKTDTKNKSSSLKSEDKLTNKIKKELKTKVIFEKINEEVPSTSMKSPDETNNPATRISRMKSKVVVKLNDKDQKVNEGVSSTSEETKTLSKKVCRVKSKVVVKSLNEDQKLVISDESDKEESSDKLLTGLKIIVKKDNKSERKVKKYLLPETDNLKPIIEEEKILTKKTKNSKSSKKQIEEISSDEESKTEKKIVRRSTRKIKK